MGRMVTGCLPSCELRLRGVSEVVCAVGPRRCAVGLMRRSQAGIMLPLLHNRGEGSLFFLRSAKKSGGMTRRWTHYLPALIVAAVLVACAAAVLAVSREAEATFPGKNGKIAYVAFRLTNGAAEIYTINPGRGGKTQITHSYNTTEFSPSYAPDGNKIAYTG
jgi:hypothetical protein